MPEDQRQEVTRLVVKERVRLPKPQRRLLRAMIHRADSIGPGAAGLDPVLQGHLAFAAYISRCTHSWKIEQLLALAKDGEPPLPSLPVEPAATRRYTRIQ